jgi:hypothetical protein
LDRKVLKDKREWLVRKVQKVCKESKVHKEFKDQLVRRVRKVSQELRERKATRVLKDHQVQLDEMEFQLVAAVEVHKVSQESLQL